VTAGPPAQATFTIQDPDGLVSLVITRSENADTVVPPFFIGTTDPVVVTSTKINQTAAASVVMVVTDGSDNVRKCGIVF
jgi:hypothetical protein